MKIQITDEIIDAEEDKLDSLATIAKLLGFDPQFVDEQVKRSEAVLKNMKENKS